MDSDDTRARASLHKIKERIEIIADVEDLKNITEMLKEMAKG